MVKKGSDSNSTSLKNSSTDFHDFTSVHPLRIHQGTAKTVITMKITMKITAKAETPRRGVKASSQLRPPAMDMNSLSPEIFCWEAGFKKRLLCVTVLVDESWVIFLLRNPDFESSRPFIS